MMLSLIHFVKSQEFSQDVVLMMYYMSKNVVCIQLECNDLTTSNRYAHETSYLQIMRISKLHVTEMESDVIHICLMTKVLTIFLNWSSSKLSLGFNSLLRDYYKINRLFVFK